MNNLGVNIKNFNKYKNIQMGEALMLSSYISFKILGIVLNHENYYNNVTFSCYYRLKNLRKIIGDFSLRNFEELINISNLQKDILSLNKLKNKFKNVYESYIILFYKMLKIFKGFYYDGGVGLNKYISGNGTNDDPYTFEK